MDIIRLKGHPLSRTSTIVAMIALTLALLGPLHPGFVLLVMRLPVTLVWQSLIAATSNTRRPQCQASNI